MDARILSMVGVFGVLQRSSGIAARPLRASRLRETLTELRIRGCMAPKAKKPLETSGVGSCSVPLVTEHTRPSPSIHVAFSFTSLLRSIVHGNIVWVTVVSTLRGQCSSVQENRFLPLLCGFPVHVFRQHSGVEVQNWCFVNVSRYVAFLTL